MTLHCRYISQQSSVGYNTKCKRKNRQETNDSNGWLSRVNAILDKLRLLGQLSNRSNYEYTDAEIEAIFKAIQKDINATKAKFREGTKVEGVLHSSKCASIVGGF